MEAPAEVLALDGSQGGATCISPYSWAVDADQSTILRRNLLIITQRCFWEWSPNPCMYSLFLAVGMMCLGKRLQLPSGHSNMENLSYTPLSTENVSCPFWTLDSASSEPSIAFSFVLRKQTSFTQKGYYVHRTITNIKRRNWFHNRNTFRVYDMIITSNFEIFCITAIGLLRKLPEARFFNLGG